MRAERDSLASDFKSLDDIAALRVFKATAAAGLGEHDDAAVAKAIGPGF